MHVWTALIFLGSIAFIGANPSQRIVGGAETTIENYPFAVAILYYTYGYWTQVCGATIINNRSFLSVAACYWGKSANDIRGRVGSSYANSGGSIYQIAQIISHPSYHAWSLDYDISVLRVTVDILYGPKIAPAAIAGPNYIVPDNTAVWVIGWGAQYWNGPSSEVLRHVQVWTVSQTICRQRYVYWLVSDNMLCAGHLDVGGRDFCHGDSGGPLLHNNVVVGISSWQQMCATPELPGVYTRVHKFTSWIQQNA